MNLPSMPLSNLSALRVGICWVQEQMTGCVITQCGSSCGTRGEAVGAAHSNQISNFEIIISLVRKICGKQ